MANWLSRLTHHHEKKETEVGKSDPTDLLSTCQSACHMSLHPDNVDDVIVVQEMGSLVDRKVSPRIQLRYNFYTYRSGGDFNKLPNLKAAYMNGKRVDTLDHEMSGRVAAVVLPPMAKEVTIDDPLAAGGRKRTEDPAPAVVAQAEEPQSLATMDADTLDLQTFRYAPGLTEQTEEEQAHHEETPEVELQEGPSLATMSSDFFDRQSDVEQFVYSAGQEAEPVDEGPSLASMDPLFEAPEHTIIRKPRPAPKVGEPGEQKDQAPETANV